MLCIESCIAFWSSDECESLYYFCAGLENEAQIVALCRVGYWLIVVTG
jgi:hypothetical protein